MKKLDESKVEWIISQKRKEVTTSSIAETLNVSTRQIKNLWIMYKNTDAGRIIYPVPMGQPKNGLPGHNLPEFEAIMMRKSDPVDLFMEWYNHRRPHMSLGVDGENETPAQAFARKMPPKGAIVVDEQTEEEYHVE